MWCIEHLVGPSLSRRMQKSSNNVSIFSPRAVRCLQRRGQREIYHLTASTYNGGRPELESISKIVLDQADVFEAMFPVETGQWVKRMSSKFNVQVQVGCSP